MEDEGELSRLLDRYKIPLGISLVGLVLLIGGLVSSGVVQKSLVKSTQVPETNSGQVLSRTIKVDISGAVRNPGVYELPFDARMEQALTAAGGVVPEVNQEYLSKSINLAQKLSDGMKIYLPFQGDPTTGSGQGGTVAGASAAGTVSLNQASLSQLEALPGIGPVSAQKIIDNRPYGSIEELLIKKVIGKATYEKIKNKISI